jgi:hypothetical protein
MTSLRALVRTAAAEAHRLLLVNSRYRLEFVGTLVTLYGVFFLMHAVAARFPIAFLSFGNDLLGEALLYTLWLWSYSVIGSVQALTASDLATGALEPLLAAGVPGRRLALGRAGGFALQGLVACAVLVAGVVLADVASAAGVAWAGVFVAFALALVTSTGFALALAGCVLLFRRVSILMAPLSIGLMAVMMSAARDLPEATWALPYVAPKLLMTAALQGRFDVPLALVGAAVAAFVGALGLGLYGPMERRAKRLGRLSTA